MLIIDEDMLKLAKMQERLLRATDSNRDSNLDNYKKTVVQIDSGAFSDLLEETKYLGEHNHSLEDELEFLENIKNGYEQLRELQLGFIRVCESHGSSDLKLSDLSEINIEYINNRISIISGYLLNIRNIEINKGRIQKLTEQLVDEEKKKDYLASKLEQLEVILRDSFLSAEGRLLVDGTLKYTSIVDEYKSQGIDIRVVLNDEQQLEKMRHDINEERAEVSEKFRTAEICYNNYPNADSKKILDEIRRDFLNVNYRFTLVKIIELLATTCINYDLFKEKREKILDLIKYRLSCLNDLGVKLSIDPFSRTKTREQLDTLTSLSDNSKIINKIRTDLGQLTDRTEDMINQNSDYLISLTNTENLLISKMSINSIDISDVELSLESVIEDSHKEFDQNQVVSVRTPVKLLGKKKIREKTTSVIERVNQMINDSSLHVSIEDKTVSLASPELIIVPVKDEKKAEEDTQEVNYEDIFVSYNPSEIMEETFEDLVSEDVATEMFSSNVNENDIFETVVPFEEPVIFEDKYEGDLFLSDKKDNSDGMVISVEQAPIEISSDKEESVEEMPDAFWITEESNKIDDEVLTDENILSFDDQINILLSDQNDVKTRKLEADIKRAA